MWGKGRFVVLGLGIFLTGTSFTLLAQQPTADAPPVDAADDSSPPAIVKTETLPSVILDRGPHQQTVQTVTLLTDAKGAVTTNISSVIAIGTGLNYFDPAKQDWIASDPTFDLIPGAATATRLQHSVTLLANPHQPGAVTLVMPDGQKLVSHVLGLNYFDAATGQSVLLAPLQDAQGQVLPGARQVVFPDAFKGLKADLRYTLTFAGLEQDIILNESPLAPETFGLNSASTRLEVVTEFSDAPAPKISTLPLHTGTDGKVDFTDDFVNFGAMQMLPGRAFDIAGESVGVAATNQFIPVGKQWDVIDGRTLLFEQVDYQSVLPLLKALPVAGKASAPARPDQNGSTGASPVPASDSLAAESAARSRRTAAGTAALPETNGRANVLARPDPPVGRILRDEPNSDRSRGRESAHNSLAADQRRLTSASTASPEPRPRELVPSPVLADTLSHPLGEGRVRATRHLLAPLPPAPTAKPDADFVQLAQAPAPARGVAIDYTILGSQSIPFTFQGDTTYYIIAGCYFSSTVTLEGGAVIKSARFDQYTPVDYGMGVHINPGGSLICKTTPFRPAIFTCKDDDSVGEVIPNYTTPPPGNVFWPGSTGSPIYWYAYRGLIFWSPSANTDVHDVRFRYSVLGYTVVSAASGTLHSLRHAQVLNSQVGLATYNGAIAARNVLVAGSSYAACGIEGIPSPTSSLLSENVTFDGGSYLFTPTGNGSTFTFNNCLITGIPGQGNGYYTGSGNAQPGSSAGVYQTVGAGAHYLAVGSTHRNAGTTSIDSTLLNDLKLRTTYPPNVPTTAYSANTTLSPDYINVPRDNDNLPDRGYHYDPIDYAVGNLNINSGVTVLMTNGVAVTTYGASGFVVQANGALVGEGAPAAMNRLFRYTCVQELSGTAWAANGAVQSITSSGLQPGTQKVLLRFTDCPAVAGSTYLLGNYIPANINLGDCQFRGGALAIVGNSGADPLKLYATNCLFERSKLTVTPLNVAGTSFNLYNNLFFADSVTLNSQAQAAWTVKDNFFDKATIINGTSGTLSLDYNGYVSGSSRLSPTGTHDVVLSASPAYVSGAFGNWYLPTSSSLLNVGSRTPTAAGMYHYTTKAVNTSPGNKEGTDGSTKTAIGFHYVSVNSSNLPIDSDGDGLPDYWEDRNGNGTTDTAETDFNLADTDGDGLSDYWELRLGTSPFLADTNGNGINDGDEDTDGDLLTNIAELTLYNSDPTDAYSLTKRKTNNPAANSPADGAFMFTCQAGMPGYNVTLSSATVVNGLIHLVLSGTSPGSTYDIYVSDSPTSTQNNSLYATGTVNQTVFDVPIPAAPGGIFSVGLASDTDGDGLSDGFEILVSRTCPNLADTDGDGIPDGWERSHGLNPLSKADGLTDPDGDGYSNLDEFILNTNPLVANAPRPVITIAATDATASEPGTDTGTFLVSRTGATTSSMAVYYGITGTAVNGQDYLSLSGQVTLGVGQASAAIIVTPQDDTVFEGTETVILTLYSDAAYTLGATTSATVNILDNELPKISVIAFDPVASEPRLKPNDTGEFRLELTGPSATATTINYSLAGATSGTDYTLSPNNPTSVVIPAGQMEAKLTVNPLDNPGFTGTQNLVLTLSPNAAYVIDSSHANATVTIGDADLPTVSVTVSAANAYENASPVAPTGVTFTFSRTGSTATSLAMPYRIGGTAINVTDYSLSPPAQALTSGTITIQANAASATLALTPIQGDGVETLETCILTIAGSPLYKISQTQNSALVNIQDGSPAAYSWLVLKAAAADQNVNPLSVDPSLIGKIATDFPGIVEVTRTGRADSSSTFNYTMNYYDANNAAMGAVSGAINFSASQFKAQIQVPFTPTTPSPFTPASPPSTHVWLHSASCPQDSGPIYFVAARYHVWVDATSDAVEGNTSPPLATLVFHRAKGDTPQETWESPSTPTALAINYTLSGTAIPGIDYTQPAISITFPSGPLAVSVPIVASSDGVLEGWESIAAALNPLNTQYSVPLSAQKKMLFIRENISPLSDLPDMGDTDGDGLPDYFEVANGLDPFTKDDTSLDTDKDGLSLLEEYQLGTNPNLADSDNNAVNDYFQRYQPLPADQLEIQVTNGDFGKLPLNNNCAYCHTTRLQIGSTVRQISSTHGVALTRIYRFLKGQSYPITVSEVGRAVAPPSGDPTTAPLTTTAAYSAFLTGVASPPGFVVSDPQLLLGAGLTWNASSVPIKQATLYVPDLKLAVDANRDGQILFDESDKTTAQLPYRFWVNDDQDNSVVNINGTPVELEGETTPPQSFDYSDHSIHNKRELEDFSRLWIDLKGIESLVQQANNGYTVGLEWRSTGGTTPAINIFPAYESNGGTGYLTDDTAGNLQASSPYSFAVTDQGGLQTVNTTRTFLFPASFWSGLSSGQSKKYLLFEGAGEGSGQLVLVLRQNGNTVAESLPVYLEIKNIKKMYERWVATPDDVTFKPPYNQQSSSLYNSAHRFRDDVPDFQADTGPPIEPRSDETQECVVFVHGWNMTYDESVGFSETMFKRLWWQRYQGRFVTFRWATLVGFNTFNTSEYRAWKYGESLRKCVNNLKSKLPNYSMNLAAHSMGNVVAGSALKRGLAIDNYVLMQAAIPAGCYDAGNSINTYPLFQGLPPTPDTAANLGYRGYLANVASSGNLVNFFNASDYALVVGEWPGKIPLLGGINVSWEGNQKKYKPDYSGISGNSWRYYFYPQSISNPAEFILRFASPAYGIVFDAHESMSFVARSKSQAVGALGITAGPLNTQKAVDLQNAHNFGPVREDHSGQFNRRIQQLGPFYLVLRTRLQGL